VGAAVFVVGSSFLVWRPEYTENIVPSKWIDWTGVKADGGDRPLPISPPSSSDHQAPPQDGPIRPDDDIGVKPLPISIENNQLIPIEISSEDLVHRLRTFLSAPVLTYAESAKASEKTCPRKVSDRQVNPDQLHDQIGMWTSIENEELVRRRVAIVKYLQTLEKNGRALLGSSATGKGRGIVMTGGNRDTTSRLLVALRILRKEHKSTLPVELFTFPDEISDRTVLDELKELGAKVKELQGKSKLNIWKNFQIKADAIISSSFDEVLYLDSDNIPLRDPSYLFDSEFYKGEGRPKAVFWPDLNKDHPDNPIWRLMGKTCNNTEFEVESGQVLISKSGNHGFNLAALHVAAHMQEDHEFYFSLSGGDKDTFRYGFWALQVPYAVSPRWLSSLGFHSEYDNRFCGIAMLQYEIIDRLGSHPLPLFVHANLLKHRNYVPGSGAFQTIKRAAFDGANLPSLDAARMWVYQSGGMCVDVEVQEQATPGGTADGVQRVVEERWDQVYEGAFAGFADMYRRHGGKGGGW